MGLFELKTFLNDIYRIYINLRKIKLRKLESNEHLHQTINKLDEELKSLKSMVTYSLFFVYNKNLYFKISTIYLTFKMSENQNELKAMIESLLKK